MKNAILNQQKELDRLRKETSEVLKVLDKEDGRLRDVRGSYASVYSDKTRLESELS